MRSLLSLALASLFTLHAHAAHVSPQRVFHAPTTAVLGSVPIFGDAGLLLLVPRTDTQCSLTENDGRNYCFADSGSFCSSCGSCCSSSSDSESIATSDLTRKSPLLKKDSQKWCCSQDSVCCSGGKCCPSGGSCCGNGCCLAGQECVSGKCLVTTNQLLSSVLSATSTTSTASSTSLTQKSSSSGTTPHVTSTSQQSHATTRTITTTETAHRESPTALSSTSASQSSSSMLASPSSSAAASTTSDSGFSLGATAGIVIGATASITALILFLMLLCRRRRQDRMRREAAKFHDAISASPPLMSDLSPPFSPAFSSAQPQLPPQHLIHPALRSTTARDPSPLGLSYPAYASYTRLGSSGGESDDANNTRPAKPFAESLRSVSAAGWSNRVGLRSDSRRSFRTFVDDGDASTVNLDYDDDDAAEAHFARLLQTAKSPVENIPGAGPGAAPRPAYRVYPQRPVDSRLPIAASMMGAGAVVAPLAPTSVSSAPPMPISMSMSMPGPLNPVPAPLRPTPPSAAPVYAASAVAMERSQSASSSSSSSSAARARARSIFLPQSLHHNVPFAPPLAAATRPSLRVPSDASREESVDGEDNDNDGEEYRRGVARARNPGLVINTAPGGVGIALSCDEALCSPFPPSSSGSVSGCLSVSSMSSTGTGSAGTLRWSQGTGTGTGTARWSQTSSLQQSQPQQTSPGSTQWKNPVWNRPQYVQIGTNAWTYAPSPYYDEPVTLPKQRQKQQLEVVAEAVSRPTSLSVSPRTRNVTPVTAAAENETAIKPYREASPGFIAELEGSGPLI